MSLRAHRKVDVRILMDWLGDGELRQLFGGGRFPNLLESDEQLVHDALAGEADSPFPRGVRFGMYMKNDRLIGTVALSDIDYICGTFRLNGGVGEKSVWGKGYGVEALGLLLAYAFGELNLRKAKMEVFTYNTSALRVFERFGFVREGTLRAEWYSGGMWIDVALLALHRGDVEGLRRSVARELVRVVKGANEETR